MTAYVEEIRLPANDGWDYGGVPFGLEPLLLPPQWRVPSGTARLPLEEWPPAPVDPDTARADDPDLLRRVFWFRWITGHQTAFVLWQLIAATLAVDAADDQREAALRARILMRGYSLTLLYAASPPRVIYDPVIRSVMARQHPYLSGAWAPDFPAVRGLLRGRVPFADGPHTRALLAECELNERIHRCIAEKLVPGAPSLLQTAGGADMRRWRGEMLHVLYDSIFMTVRAEIPHEAVVVQLLRRLRAIGLDLAANSLYPAAASSAEEEPPEMRAADIGECKKTFLTDLDAIARVAMAMGNGHPTEGGHHERAD